MFWLDAVQVMVYVWGVAAIAIISTIPTIAKMTLNLFIRSFTMFA